MSTAAVEWLALETELCHAIERHEFRVYEEVDDRASLLGYIQWLASNGATLAAHFRQHLEWRRVVGDRDQEWCQQGGPGCACEGQPRQARMSAPSADVRVASSSDASPTRR